MGLRRFIFRRLVEIAVIFFVIMTVLFILFRLAPGDPVSRMVDPSMTPEDTQLLMESMGLDKPVWTQYLYYLKNAATGNMGVSFHYGEPVSHIIIPEQVSCEEANGYNQYRYYSKFSLGSKPQ